MKKFFLFLFGLLLIFCLFVSCADTPAESTDTTNRSVTTEAETSQAPITTTEEKAEIIIPDEYYSNPELPVNCSSIVIPAEYNDGIAFDIEPVIEKGTVYFLLPSRADLSQVVYHLYNARGELITGRVADFTSDTPLGKTVRIFNREYPIVAYRSDSPTLYIEIDNRYGTIEDVQEDTSKETKAYGQLVIECREDIAEKYGWETSYISIENDAESPCSMYVKGRGNWTWLKNDKQGYSIKLEKKLALLGMSKSKKWALIGNTPDNTMLRNPLASYLGNAANMAYTPTGEIIDLYVNGEYYGAFLLSEKVDIDENRVDITDLEEKIEALDPSENYGRQKTTRDFALGITMKYWTNVPDPEDITGGYIIEMEMPDRYQNEPSGFTTSHGFYYVIKSPEYASYEQVKYIATLVQQAENALYAKDGVNPATGKAYTDYMDLDSFVKKYWIDEISKNRDGAKTSHYLYKPADSESEKLFAGPIWDYDIAFGISSETVNPEGWFSRAEKDFYKACFKHESFQARANELFFEIFYPAVKQFIEIDADVMAEKIAPSMTMNYIVWDQLDKPYEEYVEDLKHYLNTRINWIAKQLSS